MCTDINKRAWVWFFQPLQGIAHFTGKATSSGMLMSCGELFGMSAFLRIEFGV